uniref:Protein krueppel n=1 Tax=Anopheles christyi TaxID=43041 RepID=A0A182JQ58_9DIPT
MDKNIEPNERKMAVESQKSDWQSYVDNFDRLCRFCLSRERLISIYCNVQGRNVYFIRNFVKFALDLLKIKINKHDALPNFLCEVCEKNLNVIVNFKRKCDESMKILYRVREHKIKRNHTEHADDVPRKRRRKAVKKRSKQNCEEILKKLPHGIRIEKKSAYSTQKDSEDRCVNDFTSTNKKLPQSIEIQDEPEPVQPNDIFLEIIEQDKHIQQISTKDQLEETNDEVQCSTFEEEIEFTCTDDNLEDSVENDNAKGALIQNVKKARNLRYKEKIACSVCGALVNNIRSHMAIHSVRSHSCDQCPKSFTSRHKLQSHINGVHLRKRDFKCEICGKAFLEKNNLKGHMRIHNGERKYACDLCPKRFLFAGTLRSHMLTHSQEKQHKCDICEKLFLLRTTLNKHLRVHSGEKPHSCSVCDKRFRTTTHLVVHMRTHTGEKPLSCRICGMAFAHHKGRSVHMKAKHPQELVALGMIDDKGHLKCSDTVELVPQNALH